MAKGLLAKVFVLFNVCTLLSCVACAVPAKPEPPNVVVFMADDVGLGDIGFYHRLRTAKKTVVPTLNIDELIAEGMRFSDAHSPASLCAPTRFSMLTGNYPMRNGRIFGVWNPGDDPRIAPNFTTSGRLARAGGYHTAFFGKWGLGGSWTSRRHSKERLDAGALSYGFDYAFELPEGIQNAPLAFYENRRWKKLADDSLMVRLTREQTRFNEKTGRRLNPNMLGDSNWDPTVVGPVLAEKAVDYIHWRAKDKPGEPFFMYYCSQAVHIPHTPPAKLNGVPIAGATPSAFGDMIVETDVQVGMLVEALKQTGVYNNTLFVFTSDNGGLNYDKPMQRLGHDSSNGLRGRKGSIYEGGHRVPFICVWPDVIEAGSESDVQVVAHDVVAIVASLAGQKVSRDLLKDAVDLTPLFDGDRLTAKRKALLHASASKSGPFFAIREGDWKLVMKASGANDITSLEPVALFDLANNLEESEDENLIDHEEHHERVDQMLDRYKGYRQEDRPTVEVVD